MALTRAQVELVMVKRLSKLLDVAGLSTTTDGENDDLNDGIGFAVRQLGGTVANITHVGDSDLIGIAVGDYDALLDLAELRTLETIVNQFDKVDIRVGPLSTDYSDWADRAQKRLDAKRAQVLGQYGIGGSQMEAGVITLDITLKDVDAQLQ